MAAPLFTRRDVEQARIVPGSEVVSSDLETVGLVQRLDFDPEQGTLVRIILREELHRGGDRELPVALIARLDDGAIYLTVPTRDLLDRP